MEFTAFVTEEEFGELDDGQKENYTKQDDGKYLFNLKARDGYALENVQGLRNSVEAARGERDTALGKLKAFGDIEPSTVTEALAKAKRLDELDPDAEAAKANEALEEWKREYDTSTKSEFQTQVDSEKTRADGYRDQAANLLVNVTATQEMMSEEIKGRPKVLIPILLSMSRIVEEKGVLDYRIVNPETGNDRIGKDGNPLRWREQLLEMRADEEYSGCFDGTGQSGGGKEERTDSGSGGTPKNRKDMSAQEKAAFVQKNGIDDFMAIPWE